MDNPNVFEQIGAQRAPRSKFNLSYEKKFDFDMGMLIPIMCDEAVPGDVWKISNAAVVRFNPMIKPILHKVDIKTYYFFVPNRITDTSWENFIRRGDTGNVVLNAPLWPMQLENTGSLSNVWNIGSDARYSLYDYMGLPMVPSPDNTHIWAANNERPIAYPYYAYYDVWNEYFRDENLQEEYDYNDPLGASNTDWFTTYYSGDGYVIDLITQTFPWGPILYKNWNKDYFTASLPFQQKGTAPVVPLTPSGSAFDFSTTTSMRESATGTEYSIEAQDDSGNEYMKIGTGGLATARQLFTSMMNDVFTLNGVVDISDLRLALQIQQWMERNARAGSRYTEFIKGHFPAFPRDERLQRPEYIGGTSNSVIISEVLQTSQTSGSNYQGNLAGHGIGVQGGYVGTYRVEEFGVILGLMCVIPKAGYSQGMPKQWQRKTTFDYYFPLFAHLSEQEVTLGEVLFRGQDAADVVSTPSKQNSAVFGYQGRFNEMRYKNDMICGELRDIQKYWHIGRLFDEVDMHDDFLLNSTFIVCNPRKDMFATGNTTMSMVCSFGNILEVLRPMPYVAEPGIR